ncbi:uncharacterized protein LOC6495282 [Drosophila ananassae]|nr:uncharacterized protein LOC6495282 [Drosophila ananassae]
MVCGYKSPHCEVKVHQSSPDPGTMNFASVTHILVLILILLMEICAARPWWNTNEAGYDASLDPVAWSRSFVKDQVRRTRHNTLPTESRSNHRQAPKYRYKKLAKVLAGSHQKVSTRHHKKFLRRRQKMTARERYSLWRQ